jgi:hypothetical protein
MANNFNFLDKNKIKANDLINSTVTYLVTTYKQSIDAFTYATSFGQILLVTQNLFQLVLYYIQDSISELNFHTAKRQQSIYGLARLTGHNPSRGTSAVGEISVKKKTTTNKVIVGNTVYVANYTRVKCDNNSLSYILNLGAEDITIDINNPSEAKMKIMEGSIESQIFTGTGGDGQTFEVATMPGKLVDDNFVIVTVNGKKFDVYESLYDIPYKGRGVLLKTGITSGIDLIFGNGINATIPLKGEQIRVDYVLTAGANGNILDRSNLTFQFIDTAFDINGQEINLNEVFDIVVEFPPNFGSAAERPELTKNLAPYISRNFIIHDERSINYFFGRMNYFSVIKVFKTILDNNNLFKILLIPIVQNRLNPGEDYFSMDITKLTLTELERTRLLNSIDESGRKSGNISLDIVDPEIRKFVIVVMVEVFDRVNGFVIQETLVRKEIRDRLSNYMLTNKRVNKIPHSDIVRIIDEIEYVDTVKAIFVAENEEDIDTQGNIVVDDKCVAVMRGGFTDEEEVQYEDDFDPEGEPLGSVNLSIMFVKNIG